MIKPYYWPDTQGFLAVAIISIMSVIVLILLLYRVQMTDTVQGVLMTLIGVLTGCLKDVFAYYFSSSSGSKAKDDTIKAMAAPAAPPTDPLAKWSLQK